MPHSVDELINLIQNSDGYRINVKVVANSKKNSIEFLDEYVKIKISQVAVEGKANKAIIQYLSEILNIPKTKISIIRGEKSSLKIIEIKK